MASGQWVSPRLGAQALLPRQQPLRPRGGATLLLSVGTGSLPGPPQGPRRARVPSAVTGPTLPPVVRAGSRRVNPEPFLRLVAFCRQVLFYSLNAPRMPARNLSLSSPAPPWSEHPSSLLWIPATSSRLGPLHGRGLLKAIFLEEPGASFYNANPIASFFPSNPSF